MPELPEAEAVMQRLRRQGIGSTIAEMHVERPKIVAPQTIDEVSARVHGATITGARRRGKQVLIGLSNGFTIRVHLGMTGDLYVVADHRLRAHTVRAWARFSDGRALVFDDPRVLGHLHVHDARELEQAIEHLGVEPLSRRFTPELVGQLAAASKQPIKLFLMDQTRIAGLGNIYAAESLWHAAIHPARIAGKLRTQRLARLRTAIVGVLTDAIQSAFAAYMRPGRFREGEAFAAQVYGRDGEPCRRCGRKIRRMEQGGRSTYYCPGCQN